MQEWKIILKENYKLISLITIVFCLPFLIYLGFFYDSHFVKDADKWGVFGDFIGGILNPLLGFISVMALLYTVRLQLDSIRIQKEELAATREELKRSAEAQEQAKFALEEQSKIFKRQQFESIFFNLLNQLDGLQKDLLEKKQFGKSSYYFSELEKSCLSIVGRYVRRTPDATFFRSRVKENKVFIQTLSLFEFIFDYVDQFETSSQRTSSNVTSAYISILCKTIYDDLLRQMAMFCLEESKYSRLMELLKKYQIFSYDKELNVSVSVIYLSHGVNSQIFYRKVAERIITDSDIGSVEPIIVTEKINYD